MSLRGPRPGWPALAVLAVVAAGCDLPGKPSTARRPQRPEEVLDFGTLYKQSCAACHGATGQLGPAPPLNDKLFLAVVPDSMLREVIMAGRKHGDRGREDRATLMPAFGGRTPTSALKPDQAVVETGTLTAEQIEVLVKGIRAWGAFDSTLAAELMPDEEPPPRDPKEQQEVFARACAGCHGGQGQGGRYGDKPVGAINQPDFLELLSKNALRRLIITGRPDLGMPAYNESAGRPAGFQALTSQEITDLAALLDSWRRTP